METCNYCGAESIESNEADLVSAGWDMTGEFGAICPGCRNEGFEVNSMTALRLPVDENDQPLPDTDDTEALAPTTHKGGV